MAVSYKRLQHLMIEHNVTNAERMRRTTIACVFVPETVADGGNKNGE